MDISIFPEFFSEMLGLFSTRYADAIILLFLCSSTLTRKSIFKYKKLTFFLTVLIVGTGYIILDYFSKSTLFAVSTLHAGILYLAVIFLLFKGNKHLKILYVIYMISISPLLMFIFSNLASLQQIFLNLDPFGFELLLHTCMFLSRAVFVLITHFIARISNKYNFEIDPPKGYWAIAYAVSIILYFLFIKINDLLTLYNFLTFPSVILELGLLLVYIAVFYSFIFLCNEYNTKIETQLILQKTDIEKNHFAEMQTIYENFYRLKHELKNQVLYMDYMLSKKQYEELHTYFSDYYEKEYGDKFSWASGNFIVDAVLDIKQKYAAKKGIEVSIHSSLPSDLPISDIDLCTVISNLFDNAIEASHRFQAPQIDLDLNIKKGYLKLHISNTFPKGSDNTFLPARTAKPDKRLHGHGLKIVHNIVKKYQGTIENIIEDNMYHVKLILSLQKGE